MRKTKKWTKFCQKPDGLGKVVLLAFGEATPPITKLIRKLDFPHAP